jgi:hypothetical protein
MCSAYKARIKVVLTLVQSISCLACDRCTLPGEATVGCSSANVGALLYVLRCACRYGQFVFRASYYIADPPSRSQPVFDRLRKDGQYPQVR